MNLKFCVRILSLIAFFLTQQAFAEQQLKSVRVQGMVCSFCAQGLVRGAKAHPKVAAVDVSLDKKTMNLLLKDGQAISDEEIQQLVQDAGFKIESAR